MIRSIAFIVAAIACLTANAHKFTYIFKSATVPQAIQKIVEDHPELDINFIYDELENYTTNSVVDADNAYDALRQAIGFNPVIVTRHKDSYYVEALQRGKYVYRGLAMGSDGEPVSGATVMLLAPKDSTVITYGITDEAGRFSIPCDRQGVLAKATCVGYQTTYQYFDSFVVGTVFMAEMPIKLKAVSVVGDNAVLLTDKCIYRPTQRQKNASQTAVDLLRNLAIPQIVVNLVDESVATVTGADVAIFVNGLPASAEELTGIRTTDIKTVEYLDYPTDPRFGGCDHVINFIMQTYAYGGYTKLTDSQNILIGLSSRNSLYSKLTYRRMVFDIYAGANNHDIRGAGTSRFGKYVLADIGGKEQTINRNEENDGSHYKYNQYPISFRAVYDSDKIQIGNTLGFNFDQSPLAVSQGHLSYSTDANAGYTYRNEQPYTSRHYIWSGAYYFALPNDFQLSLSPRVNYGHTDYTYRYATSMPESELIENTSKENYYQISGGVALYKGLSQRHGLSANVYAGTNVNEVTYTGSATYENDFADSFAGVRIGHHFNNRVWRFTSNVALQWERNGINNDYSAEVYPLINVSGSYSPSTRHSLQAFFHYGANYPGESVKTPNILQDNELMYKTGNPDLKLSRQMTFNVQYNWVANNTFSMSAYGQYYGEKNLYVPIFLPFNNGSAILKTYSSDQDYRRAKLGVSFSVKFFDGNLQLSAQPSITVFRYSGYYNMKKNPVAVNASATYYVGRFFMQAAYQTADRTIQGNLGAWYTTRDFYQLQAGWGNSNWNVRLSAINIFRGDYLAATQSVSAPLYSEKMQQCGTYYHRRVNLSVTYTFGYGKTLQHGNEVGEQTGGSSAILK